MLEGDLHVPNLSFHHLVLLSSSPLPWLLQKVEGPSNALPLLESVLRLQETYNAHYQIDASPENMVPPKATDCCLDAHGFVVSGSDETVHAQAKMKETKLGNEGGGRGGGCSE